MKTIIVTDDDEGIQDIFKMIFERAGYEVNILAEARPLLENNFTVPDLFLLDRQLSGHDGLNVCRFLKNQASTKDVPVIIVSASPEIKRLAKEAGADDFIEKPFQMKALLSLVKKWIN
jgi:DNA-binding response OmpR family regulator